MSGMARARISALEEALKWALEEVRILAAGDEPPDSPYWNGYRYAKAVLEGRDPDKDEPRTTAKEGGGLTRFIMFGDER